MVKACAMEFGDKSARQDAREENNKSLSILYQAVIQNVGLQRGRALKVHLLEKIKAANERKKHIWICT